MIEAGTRLGPYEILAPIGAGGMGRYTGPGIASSGVRSPSKSFQQVMAVDVRTEPDFRVGTPRLLFEGSYRTGNHYDVAPDGQHFVMIREGSPNDQSSPADFIVVLNWFEELKRLAPTD